MKKALLLLLAAAGSCHAADLRVTIENVASDDGQVLIGLFDKAEAFPRQAAGGRTVAAAQRTPDGKLSVVFADLPPGTYAVSAVHDRDGNGQLNRNVMGIPTEPYGFSGKAASFGPPVFADAAVGLPAEGLALTIAVR